MEAFQKHHKPVFNFWYERPYYVGHFQTKNLNCAKSRFHEKSFEVITLDFHFLQIYIAI